MSKFKYMTFGISPSDRDSFVAHADKFTKEETIAKCLVECDDLFTRDRDVYGHPRPRLRIPNVDDVQEARCAFRYGFSPEFSEGAYTIVDDDAAWSFPVHVIVFETLKQSGDG